MNLYDMEQLRHLDLDQGRFGLGAATVPPRFNMQRLRHLDLDQGKFYSGQCGLGVDIAPARVPKAPAGATATPSEKYRSVIPLNKLTDFASAKDENTSKISTDKNSDLSNGGTPDTGSTSSHVNSGAKQKKLELRLQELLTRSDVREVDRIVYADDIGGVSQLMACDHFCSKCWREDEVKKWHPASSQECPNHNL